VTAAIHLLGLDDVVALTATLGPVAVFATVDDDGTPHVVPVIPVWVAGRLVFGSHALSRKVRNSRSRPRASIHYLSAERFGDALLVKGDARVVQQDDERLVHWESGLFPFLPARYAGPADEALRFIEFTPASALRVRNGGKGPTERWTGTGADR
jgi:general stress protein 26